MENLKLVYVGPSLSEGRLSHCTVFTNGLPSHIQKIADANPWFSYLFVPVETYTETMKTVRKKGTALYMYAKRAREV